MTVDQSIEELMRKFSWQWEKNPTYIDLYELRDEGCRLLGWAHKRPHYCDRGHWQVVVHVPGLDVQDAFPRYFMRLSTARQELVEFLAWRLHRERVEETSAMGSN